MDGKSKYYSKADAYTLCADYATLKQLLDGGLKVVCFTVNKFVGVDALFQDVCMATKTELGTYKFSVRGCEYLEIDPSMGDDFDGCCKADGIEYIMPDLLARAKALCETSN